MNYRVGQCFTASFLGGGCGRVSGIWDRGNRFEVW